MHMTVSKKMKLSRRQIRDQVTKTAIALPKAERQEAK
jgi:hypothetical protein